MGRETKKRRSYVSRAGGFMMAGGAGSLFSISSHHTKKTIENVSHLSFFVAKFFVGFLLEMTSQIFTVKGRGSQAPSPRCKM